MGITKEIVKFLLKLFNLRYVLAGAPAIILNRKEILLGKRDKHSLFYPLTWGLPGGIIEHKETIENAVKRELKEEMGIEVQIIKYGKPCMHFPNKECPLQILDTPVYCRIKKGVPKAKDETTEVRWFKPKEIKNMKLAYVHKKILVQEGIIHGN